MTHLDLMKLYTDDSYAAYRAKKAVQSSAILFKSIDELAQLYCKVYEIIVDREEREKENCEYFNESL